MPRRPAPAEGDRRQHILTAALDVFAEQGYEGAATKDIAAHADVTQGLIYFYFPSKEELFCAAFDHQAQQVFDQLDLQSMCANEAAPEVTLCALIGRIIDVMGEPKHTNLMRMLVQGQLRADCLNQRGPQRFKPIHALSERISVVLRTYLDAEIARGRLRAVNTTLAVTMMSCAMMHIIIRRALGENDLAQLARDTLVAQMADIFLHGLQ